jgi:AraC-like DNA-binding protein
MISNFYIPQSPHLKNSIRSFWEVEGQSAFKFENIMPKGIIEIIFNFSDCNSIGATLKDKQYTVQKCFINGFNTTPVKLNLPFRHEFFGVQLQPTAIKHILGVPSKEFTDDIVELLSINYDFENLWEELAEHNNFDERVAVFCRFVQKKLIEPPPQERLLNNFLNDVNQHCLSVKDLANTICYSPRHLSRKIFEATGVNTEEVLLYKKYLHALHLIHHSNLSLTDIAYQSNFSDQSHFIKTFKAFGKITPGDYKRQKGRVIGHVYEDVR